MAVRRELPGPPAAAGRVEFGPGESAGCPGGGTGGRGGYRRGGRRGGAWRFLLRGGRGAASGGGETDEPDGRRGHPAGRTGRGGGQGPDVRRVGSQRDRIGILHTEPPSPTK